MMAPCHHRLKTKAEESTRLELEHLKIAFISLALFFLDPYQSSELEPTTVVG